MISIAELVNRATVRFGSAVAVEDGTRRLTFTEVGDRAHRLASTLRTLARTPTTRVALLLPNCLEYVECDLAVAIAGLVRVPINPRLTPDERTYVLNHSGAEILVAHERLLDQTMDTRPSLPDLRHVVVLGEARPDTIPYEDALRGRPYVAPRYTDPAHPSFILYTSGTTGRPKGATSTHGGRLAATTNMLVDELDVRAGDGFVHAGSMAHGSGSKVLAHFVRGARNIPMAKFDAGQFLRLTGDLRATGSFFVPTMLSMLLDELAARPGERNRTATLRTLSYGGAPTTLALMREAIATLGPIFVQVYGSCEAPHPVTVLSKDDHVAALDDASVIESIGRETWGSQVRLAGSADDTVGELCVRGPNVMAGYWQDPEATAEAVRDGWYHTGDLATRDEAGFYRIVDRVRDMIITGGLNVYPAELERVIRQLPAVRDVAVIGIPDQRWGEAIMAYVVPTADHLVTTEQVIAHCERTLAGYKKPRHVRIVDHLPLGATGKVLKRELRAEHWAAQARRV